MVIKSAITPHKFLSINSMVRAIAALAVGIAYPRKKQELERRITDYEANLDNVMTWEEIKTSIRGKQ
ncbi:hypothetical protein H6G06_19985 [Anabaena sphaerica FACHB-251]|uniref:Uncharacterized protein n=1 Tax=Anabaena sphaerica FACHB-251 TaxID=2692883 RepID=A0A926WM69_9NOST|nr:hypothetical protein [Anabaena sphaerica]MBD2295693.1 hypothetical protein [Anabaena sphaerica FACHB-251]